MNIEFILQRLVLAVIVVLGVTLAVFLIVQLVPGDPARVSLGLQATEENVQARRERLGLNRPVVEQYVTWLGNAVQGNLGRSLITGQDVTPQILQRLPTTLQLAALALLIGMVIAFPLGIIAALRPGSRLDLVASFISQVGVAIPDFWLSILLVLLFSISLGWLPPSGYTPIQEDFQDWLAHMILPALTAGLISASIQTRFIRSAMLEVLNENYINTARAKGLRERVVIVRHALRNAMITIVTILGLQVTALLSAVVVIEIVFVLPGMGRLALDAVLDRDYPLLQGTVLVIAVMVTLINLGIDLLYFFLDPRIEYS
ncbi:MAG: glutathione ABC transporter permease GsiC [Anaerolineaceae bacterium]|nr:glutathione ABC transporter permease GsiC [Anaerolineaceae bacterium]